jgi:hypothetical protein
LETRTTDASKRTNYFFTNPAEKIKLTFPNPNEQVSYVVSKANKIGSYFIDLTPKKAAGALTFDLEIDGIKLAKTPSYSILAGTISQIKFSNSQGVPQASVP